jgi:hypothetical protein
MHPTVSGLPARRRAPATVGLVLLAVLLVLFLPAFLASLEVIGSGPWGLRGLPPKSVRHLRPTEH